MDGKNCQECNFIFTILKKTFDLRGMCQVVKVKRTHCREIITVHPSECHRTSAFDLHSRTGQGTFHSGLVRTQYSGLLSTLGLQLLSSSNFKQCERESAISIEAVVKRSCNFFTSAITFYSGWQNTKSGRILWNGMDEERQQDSWMRMVRYGSDVCE